MTDRTMLLWDEPDGRSPGGSALARGSLEAQLGIARPDWTPDDLIRYARGRGIRIVSLLHGGGDGWLKTLDFVPRSDAHLLDILEAGERADGSSLFGGLGIAPDASDIVLRPRLQTAFLDPFAAVPTLAVLCGHGGRDGLPLPVSPDTIVRRAHDRLLAETGIRLEALGEVEYFLGRRAGESDVYGADERGYHAASPFVFGQALRRRALICLADMGIPVRYGHSEVGYIEARAHGGEIWEQHEIELDLLPLPDAADAVLLTQWVLRNLAHREGMRCSTEPMMSEAHAGNGLHVHFAPRRAGVYVGGRRDDGHLSDPTRWLVAGLVRWGDALMAFGNRVPSSFTRVRQGREAPHAIVWGESDRSALVRLPMLATTEDGRAVAPPTIEFRLPDGSAHPHLVLAGVAQVMCEAAGEPEDLDALLERTRARRGTGGRPVPHDFPAVAVALGRARAVLEAGGVFPVALLDRALEALSGRPV
jgi:glutamine synthetase